MKREQLHEGRLYLTVNPEHHWERVRVTRIWDAEDHEGVAFDILEPDGTQLHYRASAMPDHLFLENYRPAFEALDDPANVLTQLQIQDATQEIHRLVDVESDDDAAAGVEETLRLAVLRAIAQGHYAPQKVAAIALETEGIEFHRSAW